MKKTCFIAGWIILGLVGLAMILSGSMKVLGLMPENGESPIPPALNEQILLIGIGEIIAAVLLLVPRTWSIGVLFTSSFWGGAIVVHMMKGELYLVPAIFLAMTWFGTFLRTPESLVSFKG